MPQHHLVYFCAPKCGWSAKSCSKKTFRPERAQKRNARRMFFSTRHHVPPRGLRLIFDPIFGSEDRTLFSIFSPHMPCMKRDLSAWKGFTETNTRRYIGQQPGTKSAPRLGDKSRINRWSTAGFVLPVVHIGFALFVISKNVQKICLRCSGGHVKRFCPARKSRRRSTLPGFSRPDGPPYVARPDSPVMCAGFRFQNQTSRTKMRVLIFGLEN